MVSWVCLQFVIVVFPDHIHLLFINYHGSRFGHQLLTLKAPRKKNVSENVVC